MAGQGPFLRAIQRVADSAFRLLGSERAIMFDSSLTVENVQGSLIGDSGSGEVSGYHKVGVNTGSAGVRVRIPLALGFTTTATSSNRDAAGRYIQISDYLHGASSVILYALVARTAGGASRIYLQAYNETNSVQVAEESTASSPGEIEIDLTSKLLGAPKAVYTFGIWSQSAGTAGLPVLELRIS